MPIITIPKTIDEATAALGGIGALITAKQWERAAIVFAFTRVQNGRPPKGSDSTPFYSIDGFARLGIKGLSEPQVRAYRRAWESAAAEIGNDDMLAIQPGDGIDMPDSMPTWKDHFGEPTVEVQERVARAYIARNPEVAVEAIKAVPAVAAAVTTAIAHDGGLTDEVNRKAFAKTIGGRDSGPSTPTTITTFEREKAVEKAIQTVSDAVKDEASGDWNPGAGIPVLLFLLTRDLNERATRIVGAQPVVHAEIDAFLAASRGKE